MKALLVAALFVLSGCGSMGDQTVSSAQHSVKVKKPHPMISGTLVCPHFEDTYSVNISTASVDTNSANYIASEVSAGDTDGWTGSFNNEQSNLATNDTPTYPPKAHGSSHTFNFTEEPFTSSYFIEPIGDGHAIVLNTDTCGLFETYQTSFDGVNVLAYSGNYWDTEANFVPQTAGEPTAMASGLSLWAGMALPSDRVLGSINHALNVHILAHSLAQYQYVLPGSDTDQISYTGTSSYRTPYAARFRLNSSKAPTDCTGDGLLVETALEKYGVYLADTANDGDTIDMARTSGGSDPWNHTQVNHCLGEITTSDFDVLTLGTIYTVPGH